MKRGKLGNLRLASILEPTEHLLSIEVGRRGRWRVALFPLLPYSTPFYVILSVTSFQKIFGELQRVGGRKDGISSQ